MYSNSNLFNFSEGATTDECFITGLPEFNKAEPQSIRPNEDVNVLKTAAV